MFRFTQRFPVTLLRKIVRQAYRVVCDPRTENDIRVNELELAAAMIAVERIGYDRLRQEAAKNRSARWLISGFTADEWSLVQSEAASDVAMVGL